jgi:hypothetical protein
MWFEGERRGHSSKSIGEKNIYRRENDDIVSFFYLFAHVRARVPVFIY